MKNIWFAEYFCTICIRYKIWGNIAGYGGEPFMRDLNIVKKNFIYWESQYINFLRKK